jgi:hypothetical protein
MDTSAISGKASREAGWRTYLRSVTFVAPALLAWAFLAVFVFPKFQQMWVDSRMMDSEFQWMMSSLHVALENTRMVCVAALILFIALEFTGQWWPRYRRAVVGSVVFVFNTAIIVGLTGVCVVGAIAGPAMVHR